MDRLESKMQSQDLSGKTDFKWQLLGSCSQLTFQPRGVRHWRVKSSVVRESKIYKCHSWE